MPDQTMTCLDTTQLTNVAAFLQGALGARNVVIKRATLLGGGAIQQNWGIDLFVDLGPWAGGRSFVLRADAPASLPASRSRAEEFALLCMLRKAGVLVPKPIALCGDPSILGRPFFVMERVAGTALPHRLVGDDGLVPDRPSLCRELAVALAAIHRITPSTEWRSVLGDAPYDSVGAAIYRLRTQLDRLPRAQPTIQWGLRWLELNAMESPPARLVHGDFRTGNYLVANGHVTAILDWEFAGFGDAREDLGWFTAPSWRFKRPDRVAGGIGSIEDFLAAYNDAAATQYAVADLHFWQLLATCRWAVIALEQAERHCSGAEPSLELALTGRLISKLEFEILESTRLRACA